MTGSIVKGLLGAVALSALVAGPAWAKTQLRVVVAHYSDQTIKTFQAMGKDFEAANPDVEVQVEEVSWDNLQQRLATDVAGGTAPDIALIATRWILDYAKQDIVEPFDTYLKPDFKAGFYENLLTPATVDGKLYGLPIVASTRALYYNKDLLAKAGVASPPATWDELTTAAKTVKDKAGGAYGFGLQGKEIETDTYWYYPFWSFGGKIVDNGKNGVSSEAGLKAANLYKSMIDDGLTQPSPTAANRQDIETFFKQGRVAMILSGPWLRGQIAAEAPKLNYGIAPMPKGSMQSTWAGSDSMVIFKSSQHKDIAFKFLQDGVYKTSSLAGFTSTEGFLPVTKSEAEDPKIKADASLTTFVGMLPYAQFAPQVQNWDQVADTVTAALQQVYLGQAKPDVALQTAGTKIDDLIK